MLRTRTVDSLRGCAHKGSTGCIMSSMLTNTKDLNTAKMQ